MQAAVIVQMHWCPSQLAGERRPTIATAPRPLQVVHAEAMHEDEHLPVGLDYGGLEIPPFQPEGSAGPAQTAWVWRAGSQWRLDDLPGCRSPPRARLRVRATVES